MSRAPVTPFAIISGPAKSEKRYTKAWTCISHSPGIRNFPRPSRTRAPGGIVALAAGPTKVIRLPETSTVLSARVSPAATSITDTCVIAIGCGPAGFRAQPVAVKSAIASPARITWSYALLARLTFCGGVEFGGWMTRIVSLRSTCRARARHADGGKKTIPRVFAGLFRVLAGVTRFRSPVYCRS